MDNWSVSNSSGIFNHWPNLYQKILVSILVSVANNIDKLNDYQLLINTLILKLKYNENISAILPIDILLMVINSAIFVRHLGPHHNVV